MIGRAARGWIAACGVLSTCAGCGFKGPLYLPEHNTTVVTHAAQAAPSATKKKANTSPAPQSPSPPQSPGAPQSPSATAPPPQ